MNLEGLSRQFLESLRVRHFSAATVASRRSGLQVFFGWLATIGITDVRDIARQTVRDYLLWLQKSAFAPWTIATRMQTVRRFFEHLEATDVLLANPCAGLPALRLPPRLPRRILTLDEAARILAAPDTDTPLGQRDRAILEVFYSSGLRLGELTALQPQDLDLEGGFVRVTRGKGGKERVTPLGKEACLHLRQYLERVRGPWVKSAGATDERALWLSSRPPHGPIKSQVIEVMVRRYGRQVGIALTPHVWRHTCATHLVSGGASIAYVQRLLGHQSLRTTQIYARATVVDLQKAHAKAHPQARRRKRTDPQAQLEPAKEGHTLRFRRS